MAKRNKPSVFEIANRATISTSSDRSSTVANKLSNHLNMSTTNAHQIINISGLQTVLDGKQDVISGYTGNVSVVVGVDFTAQAVITVEIKIVNGVITSID